MVRTSALACLPEITAAPLAAVAGRDGRFGAATLLAPGRRVSTFDAAIAADGTAAVLLGDGSVAVRPRGGAFRAPEPPARAVAVSERTP